jgi:hypothetical protein
MGWHEADGEWANLRQVPKIGNSLVERLRAAHERHPSELMFIHRDAEAEPPSKRRAEIEAAVAVAGCLLPYVCVIPVRMTEAWLLHDETAIRLAANNPRGRSNLGIPAIKQLEKLADPKKVLHDALLTASEATGRKLRKKHNDIVGMQHRIAERIQDYSSLRVLEAFARFEDDLRRTLASM